MTVDLFEKFVITGQYKENIFQPEMSRTPGSGTHRQTLPHFFKNHVKHVLMKLNLSFWLT